jgi:Lysylphosphatidylglycerol synthase TM region
MLLGMMSSPQTPARRAGRAWLTGLLLVVGLALLAWTVERLDLKKADIQSGFAAVGWWFVAIFLLTLARFAARSIAWLALTGQAIPLTSAIAASISGDALGNVTPLGLVASEPGKAMYLRHHADPASTLASLAAENFFYSASVAVYVIIASGAMLLLFDNIQPGVHLAGTLAIGTMAAVLVGATWLAWQKPALVSSLLSRAPLRSLRTTAQRVRLFEQQTYGAAGHQGRRLAIVSAAEVTFHLLSLLESWLTFWLLTGTTAIGPALVLDGVNRVINIVAKPIPARIGVEEGATAWLAGAIGYATTDGFMLALVRKVRMLVFAALGVALSIRNSRR